MSQGSLELFLGREEIHQYVSALATQIDRDYHDKVTPESPLILGITLKGALIFASDLIRELTIPTTLDFIRAKSYGSGSESSGKVELTLDLETPLESRHLLLIDEIVDTGLTIQSLIARYEQKGPASIRVCSLLSKPSRREVEVPIHYCGKEIEDAFVVGYGLDFNEKYRNLKDISILNL